MTVSQLRDFLSYFDDEDRVEFFDVRTETYVEMTDVDLTTGSDEPLIMISSLP